MKIIMETKHTDTWLVIPWTYSNIISISIHLYLHAILTYQHIV